MKVFLLIATLLISTISFAKDDPRPLLGFGLEHGKDRELGYHVFTGIQFPKTKQGHNWQWQIGFDSQKLDDITGTCRIYCRTCTTTIPGPGSWTIKTSAVIIF
jgi:hypothetical protein